MLLSDVAHSNEAEMKVVPPGFDQSVATITFAGPGTEQIVRWEKILWAINRNKPPRSPEEQLAHSVRNIVERIVDWSGFEDRAETGELVELSFSKARAMELLSDPRFGWLFGECLVFINSPTSFAPKRPG